MRGFNKQYLYIFTAFILVVMTGLAGYYANLYYKCKNDNSSSVCNSQTNIQATKSSGNSMPLEVTGNTSDISLPSNNPTQNIQPNTQQSTPNAVPILSSDFLSSFEANLGGEPNTPSQN